MDQNKVNTLFSAFAGRKVTTKGKVTHNAGSTIVEIILNPADPAIQEMEKVAKENGLQLRLAFMPAADNTADIVNTGFKSNRVTATIVCGKTTVIGNQFKIG